MIREVFNGHNLTFGGIASYFILLLGGNDVLLEFLLLVMITEYFLMLYATYRGNDFTKNSGEIYVSIATKIIMLWMIIIMVKLDMLLDIESMLNTRNTVISFFVGKECLDIYSHCNTVGVRLPKSIKSIFDRFAENEK